MNVSDAASWENCANAHPLVFGNRLVFFSMNDTDFSVSGTMTKYGDSAFFFAIHSIFTILEPSGNFLPLPGTPCRYALIIAGFAAMIFNEVSVWLTATFCQVS